MIPVILYDSVASAPTLSPCAASAEAVSAQAGLRGLEFFTSLSIKANEDVCEEIERVHRFAWNVLH